MPSQLIERALASADETEEIIFGTDVLSQTGPLFRRLFPGKRAVVIADENTYAVAGREVEDSLTEAGIQCEEHLIFPGTPTLDASYGHVEVIADYIGVMDEAIVCSIASGTLNDLVKLASGSLGRPYMNVCTAASVDGYASFGASIAIDGFKITRDCPAPKALVVDLKVLAEAPARLTATGYGDLIEKVPAGADWIIADELGIEPIDPEVWNLVQGPLPSALANPESLINPGPEDIFALAEGSIMSGLSMQATKTSRPASGAGHQFSHTWEMEGHGQKWEPPLSHGFKVGLGTVASCALWEEALKLDLSGLDVQAIVDQAKPDEVVLARAEAMLQPRIFAEARRHVLSKNLQGEELRARVEKIKAAWPRIVARASKQLLAPEEVAARLDTVGAPSHPEMVGISLDRLRDTYFKAQMIRPRYTILDLLSDIGQLEAMVDRLFSPEGYWGKTASTSASIS